MPVPPRPFAVAAALVLAAGCVTTRPVAPLAERPKRAEVLEFEPVIVTPGPPEEMALASLNDEELFALGTSAFAARDFDKAARAFARLADVYPDSPHRAEAFYNAGLSFERLGRFAEALERFKVLMDPVKGTGDALDASFRAAECLYHLDDFRPAVEILGTIAGREDVAPQDRLQAKVHRGVCLLELGELEAAERAFRDAIGWWTVRKEAEAFEDYFPAQAQFFLGEVYRLHFERVLLDPAKGEERLGKDLQHKCELLLSAQGHFLRSIRIGEGRWATASGFRIGALYEHLYGAMLEAKVPPGLTDEEARVYREELRKKVRVLVTKAMTIYERTLAAAERIGVDNPFVQQTRQSLDRMKQILLEEEPATPPERSPARAAAKPTS